MCGGQPKTADQADSAELRESERKTSQDLKHAVESIPAYIERTALLLILVPNCMHLDRHEACSFATWRARGWCRLELQAALLKCGQIRIMVSPGPEATPYFIFPLDANQLVCGHGDFTCCQRKHLINGAIIECDKAKVRRILEEMFESKQHHLEVTGNHHQQCWIGSMKHWVLMELPEDGWAHLTAQQRDEHKHNLHREDAAKDLSQQHEPQDVIELLRQRLKWQPDDEANAKKSGHSLLFYAALSNDVEAVRLLLQQPGPAVINSAVRNPNLTMGEFPFTPLMASMALGSFELVRQLLDARARPEQRTPEGFDALMWAGIYGRHDNIKSWLDHFEGSWSLERTEFEVGTTVLQQSVMVASLDVEEVAQVLLAAGANPHHLPQQGSGMLNSAASNQNSMPKVIQLLATAGVDVNWRTTAPAFKWRMIYRLAHLAVRLGVRSTLLTEISEWDGDTALMSAVKEGKVADVQALLDAVADPTLRNRCGQTALDLAKSHFGSVPPLVEELLTTGT